MRRLPASLALSLSALAAAAFAHGLDEAEVSSLRAAQIERLGEARYYRVYIPSVAMADKARISLHHALIEDRWAHSGYLLLELSDEELKRLSRFHFKTQEDHAYAARRRAEVQALEDAGIRNVLGQEGLRQAATARALRGAATESLPNFACYETVDETYAQAKAWADTKPGIAAWEVIGQSWKKSQGQGGDDIMVLKLTNKATRGVGGGAKPILLIQSAIHARELSTAPMALAFARQLVEGYGKNADATWLLDSQEVHFILHANPDGRRIAEPSVDWRKNANKTYCTKAKDAYGADLNRNYAYTWNTTQFGSTDNECMDDFRGSAKSSEPETQAMEAYYRRIWPDQRGDGQSDAAPADTMGLHIDVHSTAAMVLWSWGETKTPTGNGMALQSLGRRMAYFNGYKPMQSIGLYENDGTANSAVYGELGIPSIALELGGEWFFHNCDVFTKKIKPSNLKALAYAARVARAPYKLPAGPDVTAMALSDKAATQGVAAGTPVKLTATLDDTRSSKVNGLEPTQAIASAQVFIDVPPWEPAAKPLAASAVDGSFDTPTEKVQATVPTQGLAKGKHMVWVRGKDAAGNDGPVTARFLVIR